MCADRDELVRLVEDIPDHQIPQAIGRVRKHLHQTHDRSWPPDWFDTALGNSKVADARPEERLTEGFVVEVLSADVRAIPPDQVIRLYRTQDWWPERSADDIASVLASFPAVGAWRDEQLVGFARAISDGHFHAYIEDVVVHPDEQGTGIGSRLMQHLEELLRRQVPLVSLFCSPDLVPFYESAGYTSTEQTMLHHSFRPPATTPPLAED